MPQGGNPQQQMMQRMQQMQNMGMRPGGGGQMGPDMGGPGGGPGPHMMGGPGGMRPHQMNPQMMMRMQNMQMQNRPPPPEYGKMMPQQVIISSWLFPEK